MAQDLSKLVQDSFEFFWNDLSSRIPSFLERITVTILDSIPGILRGFGYSFPHPKSSLSVAFDTMSAVIDTVGDLLSSIGVSAVVSVTEAFVVQWEPPKRYRQRVMTVGDGLKQGMLIWLEYTRAETQSADSSSVTLLKSVMGGGSLTKKIKNIITRNVPALIRSHLTGILKRFGFLITQAIIIIARVTVSVIVSTIAINIIKDAENNDKTLNYFALRQDKPKRPAKGIRRTREVSSQKGV